MNIIRTVSEMQESARDIRRTGQTIALVPTMGSIHEGHLSLVTEAGKLADHVVVSIFINPTQFGAGEDFDAYPRAIEDDLAVIREHNKNCHVFVPSVTEMYPDGENMSWVRTTEMAETLCGTSRPDHFRGVQTVVAKLFNICYPDFAVFGLKDAQQYFIIKRMAFDLNFSVEIVGASTVREKDGVAMSSRNLNLSSAEREQAVVLIDAVTAARKMIEAGERSGGLVEQKMREVLGKANLGRTDYAQLVSVRNFVPVEAIVSGETVVAAVAFYFDRARLIDNAIISVP